jgi:hypothetical protein
MMDIKQGSKIAVIGAGISGISTASILKKNGFVPVVFEKFERIGGVWATAYPGVQLKNGLVILCDMVVLSMGYLTPTFPFLPEKYRSLLESEKDGPQLYRHLLHPRIPRLAFAGFNHGYMHAPAVEIGTQWLCAYLRGELELPSAEEMECSIEYVRNWKRENIKFENARSCAVSTHFQQYIDILLKELDVSPYRKLPNVLLKYSAGTKPLITKGSTKNMNAPN